MEDNRTCLSGVWVCVLVDGNGLGREMEVWGYVGSKGGKNSGGDGRERRGVEERGVSRKEN